MTSPLKVLMVTGAYYPEISSGGLQSQLMAGGMQGRAEVRVLTTALDMTSPRHAVVDGVPVTRVHLRLGSLWSKLRAALVMLEELWRLVGWCDVIHLHGVSTKNIFVTVMARLFRRPIVVSLHTMGADEPGPVRRSGVLSWWAFRSAARYLAVSPGLVAAARAGGIAPDRLELVPNGIDTERFAPASPEERLALRRSLGRETPQPVILFVGYFSHDKQPRVLFDAWLQVREARQLDAVAWFVGATISDYHEVDASIAEGMKNDAAARGCADRLVFSGLVHDVHRYFRLADVFVLPSRREGLPVALLEAMSCGLPCVASRLPGATDTLISDGESGLLVAPGDVGAFSSALVSLLQDSTKAAAMGTAARRFVLDRFGSQRIAEVWLQNYLKVVKGRG